MLHDALHHLAPLGQPHEQRKTAEGLTSTLGQPLERRLNSVIVGSLVDFWRHRLLLASFGRCVATVLLFGRWVAMMLLRCAVSAALSFLPLGVLS